MQQPRIFFAVALHEKYALPTDALYTPIQAGAAIHPPLGLMRDDTGENISAKNGSYCELTVLYWMAHNVDADWYGLCHYRRYFSLRRTGCPQKRILTRAQLLPLLDTADIFLPKKRHYWLETNFTQYAHAHHEEDLWKARAALARLHPGQERVFDRVMARRSGHRFNLMLMRRDALQSYASWLFPLLDAAEIDTTGYSARDKRVHGFLAERLLDVWLVYRCTVCETSLNMTVYERVEADTLEQGEYKGFLNNDRTLAAAYGSSRSLFAKNRAQMVEHWDKYTVRETDTTVPCRQEQWSEVEVWLGGYLKPRMDALFARQLGVSRSQIKGLCGSGLVCVMEGKADAGARVKNGQVFYISRECRAGRKLLAVGDAGCFYDGHAIY